MFRAKTRVSAGIERLGRNPSLQNRRRVIYFKGSNTMAYLFSAVLQAFRGNEDSLGRGKV